MRQHIRFSSVCLLASQGSLFTSPDHQERSSSGFGHLHRRNCGLTVHQAGLDAILSTQVDRPVTQSIATTICRRWDKR